MNLGQIRDYVSAKEGIVGNENFPAIKLNALINLCYRDTQAELFALGYKKWEASASLSFGANTTWGATTVKSATTPTDLIEGENSIKAIDCSLVGLPDATTYGFANQIDLKNFNEVLTNTFMSPTISNPVFTRVTTKLYLAPSTITNATIYYQAVVTALSADADEHKIPVEYEPHFVRRVVMEIDSELGKLQDKQMALQEWKQSLAGAYSNIKAKAQEDSAESKQDNARLQ